MKSTQLPQFLEYLHEHQATQTLAEELAEVLARRDRRNRAAVVGGEPRPRRIAS